MTISCNKRKGWSLITVNMHRSATTLKPLTDIMNDIDHGDSKPRAPVFGLPYNPPKHCFRQIKTLHGNNTS